MEVLYVRGNTEQRSNYTMLSTTGNEQKQSYADEVQNIS